MNDLALHDASLWPHGHGPDGRRLAPPRECEVCGTTFVASLRYVRRGTANVCSAKCRAKKLPQCRPQSPGIVRNGVRQLGRTEDYVCEQCGAVFTARVSYRKAGKARFCSYACSVTARTLNRPVDPVKLNARRLLQAAVRAGRIVPLDACSVCGRKPHSRRIDAHHPDYGKPLYVEWVCRRCHLAIHKRTV
jgi:hypothetical protein